MSVRIGKVRFNRVVTTGWINNSVITTIVRENGVERYAEFSTACGPQNPPLTFSRTSFSPLNFPRFIREDVGRRWREIEDNWRAAA